MRVIGGVKKGQRLLTFEIQPTKIRPMRDIVRGALFNILRDLVEGSRFLDLFAGTGSVGIEALSRGAKSCTFVDNLTEAVRVIRLNLSKLGFTDKARVYELDALSAIELLHRRGHRFDLIFIGPPYGEGLADQALARLASHNILVKEGIAVTEIFKKEELHEEYKDLKLFNERAYGDNLLKFYKNRAVNVG